MNIKYFALVIIGGLALGASGRGIVQKLTAPDRAEAYIALLDSHCRTRIAAPAAGTDPQSQLDPDAREVAIDKRTDLRLTQSRHKCEIHEAQQLMTVAERDRLARLLPAYLADVLPILRHPADDIPGFDTLRGFMLQPPGQAGNDQWGVLLLRPQGDSGDALQRTSLTLALSRP